MYHLINKKLVLFSLAGIVLALLVWTVLFYNNPAFKNALWEIHAIYTGTLIAYCIIRYSVSDVWIELLKVFIRTMFRVWLIIFITLAISKQMERVGFVLSVTFIFGYFEGLVDVDRWLTGNKQSVIINLLKISGNRHNLVFATMLIMSIIHMLCAIIIRIFYSFY
jgi:hypothetical protein